MRAILSFVVLLLASVAAAVSSSGNRLLAILDDVEESSKYSMFWKDLRERGYEVSFSSPKDEKLALSKLGVRLYDHVVLFPTKSKGLGPNLAPNLLLKFVKDEGNLLIALSSEYSVPASITSLLLEVDIHLPVDRHGLVIDHFNYDAAHAPERHEVVLVPPPKPVRPGTADFFGPRANETDLLFVAPRSVGQTLGPSPLVYPVVRAPRTGYSYNPRDQADTIGSGPDDLFAAGAQLSLVTAVQGRNSARMAILGSHEMLTDDWFEAKVRKVGTSAKVATYNREFAKKITSWTFQEAGVLRVNWIQHHLAEEAANVNGSNPTIYRVKSDVTFSASISEWDGTTWAPFTVPDNDEIQLEFSMLSPFWRLPLKAAAVQPSEDATVYTLTFKTPDQHGIFNFRVNYKRPFLTNIDTKDTVSVRHMAHDEWPRSYVISGAWPWIMGIGATVTGFLAFCLVFMFSAPVGQATVAKKTQ